MIEYNRDDAHRRELSRKLQLLMDVAWANSGSRPSYREIVTELEKSGVSMSRPRWGYMLNGNGPAVREGALLNSLAEFFDVPREYLTDAAGTPDVPELVETQLVRVRELRKREVIEFAQRRLGGLYSVGEIQVVSEQVRKLGVS